MPATDKTPKGSAIISHPPPFPIMGYFIYCNPRERFVDGMFFVHGGCHRHVLDRHHRTNPETEIISDEFVKGFWSLNYRNTNIQDRSITVISALMPQ